MRIVGGRMRRLGLASVGAGDAKAALRPTSDRVREAIFNLLVNGGYGDPVTGAEVLDLFAGTGALGLEALSRGADFVTFVEQGRTGGRLIADNVARTRAEGETRVLKRDATRLGVADRGGAGLVFLDPPYGRGLGEKALVSARTGGWIAPGALVIWEEGSEVTAPEGFSMLDRRRYGGTHVAVLEAG